MLLALLLAAAPALPDAIVLKTPTETFTSTHLLAVRDGRIWWRSVGTPPAAWELMPPDGLPAPKGRLEALKERAEKLPLAPAAFKRPSAVAQLSADGDNLVALTEGGAVYYTKLSTREWTDTWGPPGSRAPLTVDFAPRALAMSHRKVPYEDLDGNAHPVSAGVTTFYALSADGQALTFADPWLPPRFEHRLCLPLRGRLVANAMSASASTLFVMDGAGRSFTRLADFDTVGDDPALPYSWARERRRGPKAVIRTLPGEDWREQPRIPGPHSALLTIVQTGPHNAERELRVEGEGGFWRKGLADAGWRFEATGSARTQPLVAAAAALGPDRDLTLQSKDRLLGATVELRGFNPDCSPAVLHLEEGEERLDVPLHFHGGLASPTKSAQRQGALLLPQGQRGLSGALRSLAGGDFLEVTLEVGGSGVSVVERRLAPRVRLRFSRGP